MKITKLFVLISLFLFYGCSNNKTNKEKPEVDICKCLTEPGNSDYMIKNGEACDEAISKEIGVADWGKVNMSYDKVTSKKFDELVYRCTGKKPQAEISGVYSGIDNVGLESTILLKRDGTLIVQSSIGDGSLTYGRWAGPTDNLSLFVSDNFGDEQLLGTAKVSDGGLQIIGGKFYNRK